MVPSHRLVTQSTYSLSWRAVREVGFWDVDVIPEDSHMCFKVLFPLRAARQGAADFPARVRRRGRRRHAAPDHGKPVPPDLALGVGRLGHPVCREGAYRARDLPWQLKIMRVVWYVEEHLMWPSHWFLLTLGGLLPRLINPTYAQSSWACRRRACFGHLGPVPAVPDLGRPGRLALRPEHPDGEDPIDVLIGGRRSACCPSSDCAVRHSGARRAYPPAVRPAARVSRDRKSARPGPLPRSGSAYQSQPTRHARRRCRYAAPDSINCRSIGRTRPAARPR